MSRRRQALRNLAPFIIAALVGLAIWAALFWAAGAVL